ncbi:hypothetical protein A6A27_35000 [Micromonospora sp. CB01531]|nr:hypothetical protein A6A27_35000 [Micromonospora sp. CB01531]
MTRLDEPIGPGDRIATALLVVEAHKENRRCLNCRTPGPCSMEWWALQELDRQPGLHRLRTDSPSDQTT